RPTPTSTPTSRIPLRRDARRGARTRPAAAAAAPALRARERRPWLSTTWQRDAHGRVRRSSSGPGLLDVPVPPCNAAVVHASRRGGRMRPGQSARVAPRAYAQRTGREPVGPAPRRGEKLPRPTPHLIIRRTLDARPVRPGKKG